MIPKGVLDAVRAIRAIDPVKTMMNVSQGAYDVASNPGKVAGDFVKDNYIKDPQTGQLFPQGLISAKDGDDFTRRAIVGGITSTPQSVGKSPPLSVETMAERAGGWKPGLRQQFDAALYSKDAATVQKLLPDVPVDYQQRFAKNIQDLIPQPPQLSIGKTVPTKQLDLGDDFQTALERVSEGKLSKSKLPILATPNGNGMYSVRDGNHRLADIMRKGGNEVEIITDEGAYRKLAELEDAYINGNKPRFIKDASGKFAGSNPLKPYYQTSR